MPEASFVTGPNATDVSTLACTSFLEVGQFT